MKEKHISYYRFVAIVLIASNSLLISCFGPKNLVTQQSGIPHYDYTGDTLSGWALVRQDSLWGYISADGKQVIKPPFLWATDFADGMALAQDDHGYRYINSRGKLLRRIKATHAYSFAEGLAPVEIKGKWGYINPKGKTVIKPRFDWAEPFHENRAAVSIGLKKGFIDKNGQIIIPAIYEEVQAFKNGVAIVRKDFRFGIIDTLGNFLLSNSYDEIVPWENDFYRLGVFTPTTGRVTTFGLAGANGKLLLDTLYSYIDLQKGQYIRAKKDSLYGLFDRQGKVIVPMEYTYLGDVRDAKFMAAEKSGNWGFLDTSGTVVLPFTYQTPISASEGRIWVRKDSARILMDYQFREIKRFTVYNKIYPFVNGYATVSIKDTGNYNGNLYGYIDKDGNEVVAPQFDEGAGDINLYGIAVVGKSVDYRTVDEYLFDIHKGKLVDEKAYSNLSRFGPLWFNSDGDFISSETGRPIENFPYEKIYPVGYGERKGWAKVYREGMVGLVDTSLTELLPPEYRDIGDYYNGRIKVKKDSLWGYTDEQFRIRIPMVYDNATMFRYPMLTEVTQNKKMGVIGRYGQEIIPLHYTKITFDYGCDRIYAEKADGIDIYDKEGRLLLHTDFGYIGMYGRDNYVAYRQNGKLGFMDFDFQVLYEPEFDGCGRFYDGLAWVRKDEKGGYINERFQLVIPVQFDSFQHFVAGFAKVKKDGREYYINTKGEEFIPTEAQFKERKQELKRRGWDSFE